MVVVTIVYLPLVAGGILLGVVFGWRVPTAAVLAYAFLLVRGYTRSHNGSRRRAAA